jgi:nucleoside-diphosphate-sugar epimerase
VFWPSSHRRVRADGTPAGTPQHTVMDPGTVYGISKLAGERWCAWYHRQARRGRAQPALPGPDQLEDRRPAAAPPTTRSRSSMRALKAGRYTSFLRADTRLPMMYMPDAIRATLELMDAPADADPERGSYNLAGLSFTPAGAGRCHRPRAARLHAGMRPGLPPGHRRQLARFDR